MTFDEVSRLFDERVRELRCWGKSAEPGDAIAEIERTEAELRISELRELRQRIELAFVRDAMRKS